MRTTAIETSIDATPGEVWEVLTDFPGHAAWNPYIREAAGAAVPGTRLTLVTHPERGGPVVLRPTVVTAVPGRELRWTRPFLVRGLFDREHVLRLTEGPGRTTRLEHGERFRGLLVPLCLGRPPLGAARGHAAMYEALRIRVESARTRNRPVPRPPGPRAGPGGRA
ncbi:SRPBCC domain-containing protein [Streptomyces subrutilus]|uniref:SRPBCC domain-containing protein n=1 Tax=Streptomyces subrutilus TaxID=36818 RepID=UPI0033FE6BEF